MATKQPIALAVALRAKAANSQATVLQHAANELVFAVVGHVGSGTTAIAQTLVELLSDNDLNGGPFDTHLLKARTVIDEWSSSKGMAALSTPKRSLQVVEQYQDRGDSMRSTGDFAAVARGLVQRIREARAKAQKIAITGSEPIAPNGERRAYVLDSIRHPAEVNLLRHIYQDAFVLIGIVCEEQIRLDRVVKHYSDAGEENARKFMERDAKAVEPFGQKTSDAFHLADFFVDNTADRFLRDGSGQPTNENPEWEVNEKLSRLIKIITHSEIVRPDVAETAMQHAYGAKMKSACLSRQVGAALVDKNGNIVATGTNEVPRAGGGLYGEHFDDDKYDHRCAYRNTIYCSNTKRQNEIIDEVISEIPQLSDMDLAARTALRNQLRAGKIGDLLEFSRAVHAEMDALLSAARAGLPTQGTRLFVTTFPCHYCARHLISAGVDDVQYIEPYPKSEALKLHSDAIQLAADNWIAPSERHRVSPDEARKHPETGRRVLFRPFSGVAPRMYRRAFLKDRELKNKYTGAYEPGAPDWGTPWHLRRTSYVQLETELLD